MPFHPQAAPGGRRKRRRPGATRLGLQTIQPATPAIPGNQGIGGGGSGIGGGTPGTIGGGSGSSPNAPGSDSSTDYNIGPGTPGTIGRGPTSQPGAPGSGGNRSLQGLRGTSQQLRKRRKLRGNVMNPIRSATMNLLRR